MAAQDFRHMSKREGDIVANFIRCRERSFQLANGQDGIQTVMRDMLLHDQLQEGVKQN